MRPTLKFMKTKEAENRGFVGLLVKFYAPLFDERWRFLHFLYGFPKDNKIFDLIVGLTGPFLILGICFLPDEPGDPLSLVFRGAVVLWWATFLVEEIFGRKRKLTAVGAVLSCWFGLQYVVIPFINWVADK